MEDGVRMMELSEDERFSKNSNKCLKFKMFHTLELIPVPAMIGN
jgi:hypothetical protein